MTYREAPPTSPWFVLAIFVSMALFAGWLDAQIPEASPIVHMDKADSMKLLMLQAEVDMAEERRNGFGKQLFYKYGLSSGEYGLVIHEGIFKLIENSADISEQE